VVYEADQGTREEQNRLFANLITGQSVFRHYLYSANRILIGAFIYLGQKHHHGIGIRTTVSILTSSDSLVHTPTIKMLLKTGFNGMCQRHPKSDNLSVTVALSALAGHMLLDQLLVGGKEVLLWTVKL